MSECFSGLWWHTTMNIDQVLSLYCGPFIAKRSIGQGYYRPHAIYYQWMESDFWKRQFKKDQMAKGGCDSPGQMECCTSSGWMAKSVSSCAGGKHHSLGSFQERSLETPIKQWGGGRREGDDNQVMQSMIKQSFYSFLRMWTQIWTNVFNRTTQDVPALMNHINI